MNYALGLPPISACPRRGAACRTQAQKDCAYPSMVCSIVGSGRAPQTAEHAAPTAGRRRSVRKRPGVRLDHGVGRRGRRGWAPAPPPERFCCSEGSYARSDRAVEAVRTPCGRPTALGALPPGVVRMSMPAAPSRGHSRPGAGTRPRARGDGAPDGRTGASDRPGPRDARGRPAARVTAAGADRARGPLTRARPGRKAAATGRWPRVRGPGEHRARSHGPRCSGLRAQGGGRHP